jgi:hypothetical protein
MTLAESVGSSPFLNLQMKSQVLKATKIAAIGQPFVQRYATNGVSRCAGKRLPFRASEI